MAAFNNSEAVVIDNGTGLIKAGFAGEDSPQAILPTSTNFRLKVQYGSASEVGGDGGNTDPSANGGSSNAYSSASNSEADGNGNANA